MSPPRLIVGLGNPGDEYADTRHNIGFWFIDQLARRLQVPLTPQGKFLGRAGRQGDLWLLQPMTYMNLSGQAVAALARFYKIAAEETLVDPTSGGGGVRGTHRSRHLVDCLR